MTNVDVGHSPTGSATHGTPGNDALLSRADDPEFVEYVRTWLGDLLAGNVVSVEPIVAGTRASWSVDLTRGAEDVPVIVRQTRDTLQIYGDAIRETKIYAALGPTPVPVPKIYGIDEARHLVAAERVLGTDDLRGLDPGTREAVSDSLMRHIADLHALDPSTLDMPEMAVPATARENSTLDVDHWQNFHRTHAPANPVVTYACNWLRRNASSDVARTVLVQGDTGPGNFGDWSGWGPGRVSPGSCCAGRGFVDRVYFQCGLRLPGLQIWLLTCRTSSTRF